MIPFQHRRRWRATLSQRVPTPRPSVRHVLWAAVRRTEKRAWAGNGHRVAGAATRVPDMWRSGGLCSTLAFGSASLTSSMVRHASPPREDRTRPDGRVSSASLAASSGRQAAGSAEASISRVPCKRTPSLTCYFPRNRMLSSMTLKKAIELPQGWEQLSPRYTTTACLGWRTEGATRYRKIDRVIGVRFWAASATNA